MHKRFLGIIAVLCLIAASPPVVHSQSKAGPFTISSASSPCAKISVTGQSTVGIAVSGTFSATLQPEVAITGGDGSTGTPANTQVTPSTSSTAQSTITATGVYSGGVGGADTFLLCVTSYSSGAATIYLNATKSGASSGIGGGGGGGGTGTVTHTVGSLTATQVVIGNQGADIQTDAALLDNSTNWVSTEPFQLPVGAVGTPSVQFTGHLTSGLFYTSGHGITMDDGSTPMAVFDSNQGVVVADGNTLCFSPNANGASCDTNLAREAANVLGVGSSEVGLVRDANVCRITADVSLTVNTANSFCSFSLPALAKAWGWHCDVIWAITAGTGTNTFSLGVNASQTPTAATNAAASILTTQTGTQTQGVAALSASGAVNVLTSPTYTPAATLQQATAIGNVLASATAGTFAITATAAGTTATAVIKAGTTCVLN